MSGKKIFNLKNVKLIMSTENGLNFVTQILNNMSNEKKIELIDLLREDKDIIIENLNHKDQQTTKNSKKGR